MSILPSLNYALYFILYIPGGLELAFSFFFFFCLFILRRKYSTQLIPRSIFLSFLSLFLGFSLFLHILGNEFRPLLAFTYLLLTVALYFAQKTKKKSLHLASPFLVAALYGFFYWQFTFVEKEITLPAIWEIGERGTKEAGYLDEQLLVTFKLDGNQSTSTFTDELANYLKQKKDPQAQVTLSLLYHWGRFAGHSLAKIDGREFPSQNGFATYGCSAAPCTRYYYGVRGL
jgi:hypothetical protein